MKIHIVNNVFKSAILFGNPINNGILLFTKLMGDKWKDEKGFSLFVFSLSSGLPKENFTKKLMLYNYTPVASTVNKQEEPL